MAEGLATRSEPRVATLALRERRKPLTAAGRVDKGRGLWKRCLRTVPVGGGWMLPGRILCRVMDSSSLLVPVEDSGSGWSQEPERTTVG